MTMTRALLLTSVLLVACGGDGSGGNSTTTGDGGNSTTTGDGGNATATDARIPVDCVPGDTQCTDCIDNDNDGMIDGFDPLCTSAQDDYEDSFATGIPGDNMANSGYQDCFYDGNSGSGANEDCKIPNCCLYNPTGEPCPAAGDSCSPTSTCIEYCRPAVAPGCDCFGCCTVCLDGNCRTILTHPELAPDCTQETLNDPNACPTCTLSAECSNPCDPANCILCPGQSPQDLPASCDGQSQCVGDATTCTTSAECAADEYCASGCCVANIIIN